MQGQELDFLEVPRRTSFALNFIGEDDSNICNTGTGKAAYFVCGACAVGVPRVYREEATLHMNHIGSRPLISPTLGHPVTHLGHQH